MTEGLWHSYLIISLLISLPVIALTIWNIVKYDLDFREKNEDA